ncbi:hypothetical protein CL630_01900 [bacterium]|nr:hypothetical protein [bacterium]|tara:strand:- start:3091 stop:3348 length:258 start_codon:yes stop_codon:yes gene_type:complete
MTTTLKNPVLYVHKKRTGDDIEAEKVVRKLIAEYDPSVQFEVNPISSDAFEHKMPFLFASLNTFPGIEQIRGFVEQERRQQQKAT